MMLNDLTASFHIRHRLRRGGLGVKNCHPRKTTGDYSGPAND